MTDSRPSYRQRPIASIASLARQLGIGLGELHQVIERSDTLYRLVCRKPKKQGGFREIREALEPLKSIQKRIVVRILGAVSYPDYLMGGIKDPEHKRGYIRSAGLHAGAGILVSEDIADFFPSISTDKVHAVFQHVCHCRPDVAAALARLCTRRGEVPQGASTSTAIANLVLFQQEPDVVERLSRLGFKYSRFVDDVNVSSERPVADEEVREVVGDVRGLLERSGFQPKRKKQFIGRRGRHIAIHNLNVDARATIPLPDRKRVRAMVHRLERKISEGSLPPAFQREIDQATSHAARIRQLHPREGQALMSRIRALRKSVKASPAG